MVHPALIVATRCVKDASHLINASIATNMFVIVATVLECILEVAKTVARIANMFVEAASRRAHGTNVHIMLILIASNAGVTSAVNAMRRVMNAIKYGNVTIVKNITAVVIESKLSKRTTTMATTTAVTAVTIS